jgi:hypothetical protein
MKWTRGQETVDALLAEGRLELVAGAEADGTAWLVSDQAFAGVGETGDRCQPRGCMRARL